MTVIGAILNGISPADWYALIVAIGLLLVDFVLGVLIALLHHVFCWGCLPKQFETLIFWNGAGLSIATVFQSVVSGNQTASVAIVGVIGALSTPAAPSQVLAAPPPAANA